MEPIRLECIIPEQNRARFYVLYVTKTLWNTWALLRRWGRIGQEARGVRMDECSTEEEVLQRAAEVIELRMRHGYRAKSVGGSATDQGSGI
jgi:predicted DNA-binding WGR domain protein